MKSSIVQLPLALALALALSSAAFGAEMESFRFIDRLLSISAPVAPQVFDGAVIFTASARQRRVGVAFAHEGFGSVHWFKLLDSPNAAGSGRGDGVLFLAYEYPPGLRVLEYRLIADGLWTTDPWNPLSRTEGSSGIGYSLVELPPAVEGPTSIDAVSRTVRFRLEAPPGRSVSVAGTFNNWDPFMYELREERRGVYSLTLPLSAGVHRYAFYVDGERTLDPGNPRKVYAKDGKTASEIRVE
jgi:hypothetical protein